MRKQLQMLLSKKYTTPTPPPFNIPVTIADSRSECVIPLSSEKDRFKYLNQYNHVRMGRILEDFDTFAVHISYKHNDSLRNATNNTHPLGIVTALVDDVHIHRAKIPTDKDLKLVGNVSWTGRSSMEIFMQLFQNDGQLAV